MPREGRTMTDEAEGSLRSSVLSTARTRTASQTLTDNLSTNIHIVRKAVMIRPPATIIYQSKGVPKTVASPIGTRSKERCIWYQKKRERREGKVVQKSASTIGPGGFEPPLTDPKSAVLPLDEGPLWKCRRSLKLSNRWTRTKGSRLLLCLSKAQYL